MTVAVPGRGLMGMPSKGSEHSMKNGYSEQRDTVVLPKAFFFPMSNLQLFPPQELVHLAQGRKHAPTAVCVSTRKDRLSTSSACDWWVGKPLTWGLFFPSGHTLPTPISVVLFWASFDGMLEGFSRACLVIQPHTQLAPAQYAFPLKMPFHMYPDPICISQ